MHEGGMSLLLVLFLPFARHLWAAGAEHGAWG